MGNDDSNFVNGGGDTFGHDTKFSWSQVEVKNTFSPRDGHCACSVDGQLFIFGGVLQSDDADENIETNELVVFNPACGEWAAVAQRGKAPRASSAATMAAVGRELWVFGGLSQLCGWMDTLHVFTIESSVWGSVAGLWTRVEGVGPAPTPRDKLASAVVDGKIYFFGGFGPRQAEAAAEEDEGVDSEEEEEEDSDDGLPDQEAAQFGWFNDLHVLDPATRAWSRPPVGGARPSPRAAATMCAVGGALVVVGGRDKVGRRNDVHVYDTGRGEWRGVAPPGPAPALRSFHTATAVGGAVLVIGGRGADDHELGDVHVLDTARETWTKPEVSGAAFPPRALHTVCVVGQTLIVVGGSSQHAVFCDVMALDAVMA